MKNRTKPHLLRLVQNVEMPLMDSEIHKQIKEKPATVSHINRGVTEITDHAKEKLKKILHTSYSSNREATPRIKEIFEHAFLLVVKQEHKRIMELGREKKKLGSATKLQEAIKEQKKTIGAAIHEELQYLNKLKEAVKDKEGIYKKIVNDHNIYAINEQAIDPARIDAQHRSALAHFQKYPPIPTATIYPTKLGDNVPTESGIYFLWNKGHIIYVGQSINLQGRLRSSHPKIQEFPQSTISWVLVSEKELVYAECYYIALCEPPLNRGTPSCIRDRPPQNRIKTQDIEVGEPKSTINTAHLEEEKENV
jgi:hypothetical protein